MSLKPYVFVPPGPGKRRVAPLSEKKKEADVLDAGWFLTAVMGFLLMGVAGWMMALNAKNPALAGRGIDREILGAAWMLGSAVMGVFALALYGLLVLYSLAWMVVPLVAMAQGKGWGAILFFLCSPLVLIASGLVGVFLGMIIGGLLQMG